MQHGAEFINGKGNKIYEIAEDLGLVIGEVEDDHLIFDGAIQSGMCAISEQVWKLVSMLWEFSQSCVIISQF